MYVSIYIYLLNEWSEINKKKCMFHWCWDLSEPASMMNFLFPGCICLRVIRKHWLPVRGPPLRTGSADYLRTGPRTTPTDPLTDHPQNSIKNKNKDFTYCFSDTPDRSLVSAKFRALRWAKCNRLGFSLGRKVIIVHCYFVCCGYNYARKTGKTLRSLEIRAALCAFPLPFCSAYSLAGSFTRPGLHNFLSSAQLSWDELSNTRGRTDGKEA